jgi:hypothetical protein
VTSPFTEGSNPTSYTIAMEDKLKVSIRCVVFES